MNNRGDEPRSLLRRLLKKADELASRNSNSHPDIAPKDSPNRTVRNNVKEASPVRPTPPEPAAPPPPIAPQPRAQQAVAAPVAPPPGVEERLQAEEALEVLREKTAHIANEFAEGKLNRAQFTAMYAHFNEKRVIIERLLARNPDTQAWQQVAKGGQTSFLRQHFEARVQAYTIFDNGTTDPQAPINAAGPTPLPPELTKQVLTAVAVLLRTRTTDKPLRALQKQIDNGRWIAIIPGTYTSAIALFSLEPSAQQFNRVVDMHRDFERANRVALERGTRQPDQLVFPHRALFEKPGQQN